MATTGGTSGGTPYYAVSAPDGIKPKFGVLSFFTLAYVALLPFQIEISPMLRVAPGDLFLLLAIAFAPFCLRYRKDAWSGWHWLLLLVFAMASMVMVVRSGELNSYALLNKDIGLLVLFGSYVLITSEVNNWARLRRLLRVFAASVVLQNLAGIAAAVASYLYGIDSILMLDRARLCGMLVDPNAYGGLLICAFVVCETGNDGYQPLFNPAFLLFARLTLTVGLALTFSRTAWIAFAVVLGGLLFTRFQKTMPAVMIAVTGIVALGFTMGTRFLPRFQDLATRDDGGRMDLLSGAMTQFSEHPFVGGGITAFQGQTGAVVHVTAAWFLADFGLIGFVVFLGFIGWFARKALYCYRYAPARERPFTLGLLLTHLAMVVVSMGIDAFYQRHWWMILALIASSCSLLRRSRGAQILVRADLLQSPAFGGWEARLRA